MEKERVKVVVRYVNGKVLKGYTQDFVPNKDRFHLFPADKPDAPATEVLLKDLKSIFLVRDFAGDPQYVEKKKSINGERSSGRKLEVTFLDGELLAGFTLGYDRNRPGFFVLPADPKSNNIRVFAVASAVKQVPLLG